MRKILLMGNPNVGKSVVFNRLTGADVISSNYPGTTVEFEQGYLRFREEKEQVIDVPGTYTLEPSCKAEEIAVKILNEECSEDDIIVNVVDATKLERSLNLTLQLIKTGKPVIVALNLWDETKHTGIEIDTEKLQETLGVPCIPVCAVSGEGIKELVSSLGKAACSSLSFEDGQRWNMVGSIVKRVQVHKHRHHTIPERLGEASIHPMTGIPIAIFIMALTFFVIRQIGEGIIGYVMEPLFENLWTPVLLRISSVFKGSGFLHDIVIGKLIQGEIDYGQSFGLLSTGLFIPIGAVLPYIIGFYFVISFLEDSGYLPRLAVMVDTVMHKMGLHGLAIMPMFLGLGCNVPGALATRIMESKREKFITATLMSIAVPCVALQAMIVSLVGPYGIKGIGTVYLTLFIVWLVTGVILGLLTKGESPEIFVEIPPYRMPFLKGLLSKTLMRVKWFLKEALPFVLLGILIATLLYNTGVISYISAYIGPVVNGVLGLPDDAVGALVIGFLRKDVAVGMLAPLDMTLKQLIIASVVLSMYFPCIATFSVLVKELGVKDMLKSAGIMVIATLITGGTLNLILT